MRVLVIDDEPDILGLCEVPPTRDGYEVLQATTADSGLELALEERPDLIVLDIMLPNRDGFALLEELVATPVTRDIPVVILTARVGAEDRARGWEAFCGLRDERLLDRAAHRAKERNVVSVAQVGGRRPSPTLPPTTRPVGPA